jgi:hypothetical protein
MPANLRDVDWAGGPGQSVEDVKWLDQKMGSFFEENSLTDKVKKMSI